MTGFQVRPVEGLPEVQPGDDLAQLLALAAPDLADGEIVVVTSKIVSKAEGRLVQDTDREASIDAETVRVVARRDSTRIVETRHGLVLAAAGVDASNTATGTVLLLPLDPDASARSIRHGIRERLGVDVGVIVSDTLGRPWRLGLTDAAIGVAGLDPLDDYRGRVDAYGNPLQQTIIAIADELAAAADLVKGKLSGIPAAVVRGLAPLVTADDGPGARALVRPAHEDLFRLGARDVVLGAVAAALTAPAPHHTTPWRFVLVETPAARTRLLDAMATQWVADLRADGFSEESIGRRLRRGDVLRAAPFLVVPCLVMTGSHTYPDARRAAAEREMFLVAMGAGVENLLISLAVEGLGSAWVSSTLFCQDVARAALDLPDGWDPMGTLAVGHPVADPPERPARDLHDFIAVR